MTSGGGENAPRREHRRKPILRRARRGAQRKHRQLSALGGAAQMKSALKPRRGGSKAWHLGAGGIAMTAAVSYNGVARR